MLIVSFIVMTPPFYATQKHDRQLLNYVQFLKPLALVIEYDQANIVMPKYPHEIAHYLYGTNVIPFETRFKGQDVRSTHASWSDCMRARCCSGSGLAYARDAETAGSDAHSLFYV